MVAVPSATTPVIVVQYVEVPAVDSTRPAVPVALLESLSSPVRRSLSMVELAKYALAVTVKLVIVPLMEEKLVLVALVAVKSVNTAVIAVRRVAKKLVEVALVTVKAVIVVVAKVEVP